MQMPFRYVGGVDTTATLLGIAELHFGADHFRSHRSRDLSTLDCKTQFTRVAVMISADVRTLGTNFEIQIPTCEGAIECQIDPVPQQACLVWVESWLSLVPG